MTLSRLKHNTVEQVWKRIVLHIFLGGAAALTAPVNAGEWVTPQVTVCTAIGAQTNPQGVSDGAGGAIISWIDLRSGSRSIYAQKINESGVRQWPGEGIIVCSPLTDLYTTPQVISDGAGGVIVGWTDIRNNVSGVYAQRVNSNGMVQWTPNGVAVSSNIGVRYTPKLTSDGAGGAILVWRGYKNSDYNIYAQRVNNAGAKQWGSTDFPIAVTAGYVEECELVTDGHGGAIMSWYDRRGDDYDIYAQRVSHTGVRQWTLNGIPVCTALEDQANPRITYDGADGAIIVWQDFRSGNHDVYAQRVNAAGIAQWPTNGISVSSISGRQWLPEITSDGTGGAVILWEDNRRGPIDIYGQRLNSAGTSLWLTNGILLGTGIDQESPAIASVPGGGALFAWKSPYVGDYMTLVREVDAAGSGVPDAGNRVVTGTSSQFEPALVTDSTGQAILVWDDNGVGDFDIWASQVRAPSVKATVRDWELYN